MIYEMSSAESPHGSATSYTCIRVLSLPAPPVMHARTRPTLYEQLEALPEGLTGEILNGQLYTQPRPSGKSVLEGASDAPSLAPETLPDNARRPGPYPAIPD